ncbi:hypothetical protein KEM48_011176 [Puccinia striiformis f. sp. tritici PST-130]|nr:hypothetical protein KEM48_011176 [Puccinia striiformis f. sp. tritici PST-130]
MKIELEKLFFPTRFEVIHGPEGSFESKLISLQDFPAGEVLATLGLECQVSGTKAYTSVLTFAYFSTEWHMAQPFQCACGSKSCLGMIRGAQHLPKQTLDKYFINEHIQRMKQSAE